MEEALVSELWHAAMMEELSSIKENNTWSLVDLPRKSRKRDEHGEVVKHKSEVGGQRLCVEAGDKF
jgi:hypothetical protein